MPLVEKIDPTGDLCLKVRMLKPINSKEGVYARAASGGIYKVEEDNAYFLVHSCTLKRAWPQWKELLPTGLTGCGPPHITYIVELPVGSSFRAMATLLHIIHLQLDQVLGNGNPLDREILYEITVLTDAFNLTHILRPRARNWLNQSVIGTGPGQDMLVLERTLWIAWELGDLASFEATARNLALNFAPRASNGSTDPIRLFSSIREPPGMLDAINSLRLKTIERMVSPFRSAIDTLKHMNRASSKPGICRYKNMFFPDQGPCEAYMLGQLERLLTREHLLPLPSPDDVLVSVATLAERLKAVDSEIKGFNAQHRLCKPVHNINSLIDEVLADFEVELTATQIRRMREQAEISGLFGYTGVVHGHYSRETFA
ncbi:hypothetical protein HD806DRAFT_499613 [Xylariaceae sp. AK1471]|nr:hypothetical protein HD806DRAFT_499613 [Xylariaceae sp. AK1471]